MFFIKSKKKLSFYSFCLILIVSMTYFTPQIVAKTIVVDQTGNGDHLSIQSAIDSANSSIEEPMDTILIKPGVYQEAVTINRALNLLGSGPNLAKITQRIIVTFANKDMPKDVTISSLSISNQQQYHGIQITNESARVIIKNCIIDGCRNGIYVNNQPSIRVTILNNTIVNNSENGIYVSGSGNSSYYYYRYLTIQGNIIAYNTEYAIYFYGSYNRSQCYSIDYNDFYSNDATIKYDNSNIDSDCKSYGGNSFQIKPLFVNKDQANYALKHDSSCINKGLVGSSNIDPDGTRGDIGAYSGPNTVSFWPYPIDGPIVTDLTVNPVSVPKGGKITINAKGIIR